MPPVVVVVVCVAVEVIVIVCAAVEVVVVVCFAVEVVVVVCFAVGVVVAVVSVLTTDSIVGVFGFVDDELLLWVVVVGGFDDNGGLFVVDSRPPSPLPLTSISVVAVMLAVDDVVVLGW